MKKYIYMILGLILMITVCVPVYAVTNNEEVRAYVSTQNVKALEEYIGIETLEDEEVFAISKVQQSVVFDFIAKSEHLAFLPAGASINSMPLLEVTEKGLYVASKATADNGDMATIIIDLPNAWSIDYARNEDGSIANGSLAIFDELGEAVASTGLVTAVDATGTNVPAEFVIKERKILVSLEEENVTYPVDFSYGIYAANAARSVTDYFSYAGFNLVYDGSLTLGSRYFDVGSTIECTNAWNAVYSLFYPYSPYWTTSTQTESMNDQFWCHADFAKTKAQWNLEPWRPVVSWATMLANACNPE